VARLFTPVAAGYWRGQTAFQAWGLTIGFGVAILCTIGAGVVFSYWNRWFFDALEQKNVDIVLWSMIALLAIAVVATSAEVALVLARETVQVRWRAWLSREIIDRWLQRQRFYHLNSSGGDEATVPEYRIADDVRWATEPVMDFYHGLLGSTVSIISFVGILWVVGGSLTVGSGESAITVPGYLAVAGVIHAAILMALMLWVGGALPANMRARNEAEAHFRLALMRVRENADSVALTHGESGERAILWRALDGWVRRWMVVVRQDGQLTWILRGNGFILSVIPLLLASPKYLSGELSLGAVMQIVSAYLPFQTSIAWAVDNFRALSNWHASARRVAGLLHSMDELDGDLDDPTKSAITFGESQDGAIHVEGLTVANRDGDILVNSAGIAIAPGEKVLVRGESGTGKSALARAIAGLWPWGVGRVHMPAGLRLSFVPQRAYLPLGTLRDVLRYPLEKLEADDGAIVDALVSCGIGHLAPKLDTLERWDQLLSNGERQRLAFARLILQKPTVAILDDAVAALGDESQAMLMNLLRENLPDTMVISIAQHGGLERFHDRVLALVKADGGARLQSAGAHRFTVVRPGE
jgi:vitamin B12/bleomycin/antimicrobial peptide transport system ATP-binding/permease protein